MSNPYPEWKIWQVQERDKSYGRAVVSGQTRYVPATSRNMAKEIYAHQYKKYPDTVTSLTANVISDDIREWGGEPTKEMREAGLNLEYCPICQAARPPHEHLEG